MINNKKIALVRSILELSIEITNKSDIDIFCNFSSHVKSFSIKILLNGWNNEEYEIDFDKTVYLDWDCEKDLNDIIKYLNFIERDLRK